MARRQLLVILAAASLAGCGTVVTLTAHDGGPGGVGNSPGARGGRGALNIDLDGKRYVGEWLVSADGGFTGFDKRETGRLAKATGMITEGVASNGDGRAYADAQDGSTLRCSFRFNAVTSVAQGRCQRNDGHVYDLTMKR